MKRILYIQHAGTIGGSAMSLRLTLQALDRERFTPIIGLVRPSEAMHSLYADIGVPTIDMPDITTYEHTTGFHWGYMNPAHWIGRWRQRCCVARGAEATIKYTKMVRPDLVHLNSVVLLPSAVGLSRQQAPFVWHIREHPVPGLFGQRLHYIRRCLLSLGDEVLFLSEADRNAWLGGPRRGVIFPNYVDFDNFAEAGEKSAARKRYGLPRDVPVVLFMGGISRVKGTMRFLQAIQIVRVRLPELRVLMPIPPFTDSQVRADVRLAQKILPHLGMGTYYQRAKTLLKDPSIASSLVRIQATTDVALLYRACDILVYPHTKPHFARPVIEAAAAHRTSVASDLPGMEELMLPDRTAILVNPNDCESLANAVSDLLANPDKLAKMGNNAFEYAKSRFSLNIAINRLQDIYENILHE